MLQHRSMHAATVARAEHVSRACGWCARRAQSLLSNWSSRAQFYGFMPNFPTALRLLVVLWLWHTVAMDAQHTHQGKEDFQQQPAMGSGWKMLKLVQCCFFIASAGDYKPDIKYQFCFVFLLFCHNSKISCLFSIFLFWIAKTKKIMTKKFGI